MKVHDNPWLLTKLIGNILKMLMLLIELLLDVEFSKLGY